ncbi:MAG: hypothetical protein QNJ62_05765 [Methyloceanibacter sp.]|nr:hypothetical protein [Methyloceanibacter sp.]
MCRTGAALAAAAAIQTISFSAVADSPMLAGPSHHMVYEDGAFKHAPRADGHGPIGVMGDHRHHRDELMLSYRYMNMWMDGNQIGTDDVSPQEIVTTVPNRFFGQPMQPPTLRVVPTDMNMNMHMFGAMYGLTDQVTLSAMLPYIEKDMNHITFKGPMGTTELGRFNTNSDGVGDLSFGGIIGLYDSKTENSEQHLNLLVSLSAPTGSITQEGRILTPMGTTPVVRLPYAMQLGSGTWDILPGIVYTARTGNVSFGAQYRGNFRLEDENDEGYRLGNLNQVTGWAAYQWAPWVSSSFRVAYQNLGEIEGIDPNIVGPVQTANPDYYGGDRVDLLLGVNLIGQRGVTCGHRLAAEVGVPVYQDLNGPQMETDYTVTVGWQKTLGDC